MEKELFCVNDLFIENLGFMSQNAGMIELEGSYPIMMKGDKFIPNETESKEILKGLVRIIRLHQHLLKQEKTTVTMEELNDIKRRLGTTLSEFMYSLNNIEPNYPLSCKNYNSNWEYLYIKDIMIWNKQRIYILGYKKEKVD